MLIAPAYAHHSASSEFDVQRTIKLTGTMTKMEWINPHTYMHIDVPDAILRQRIDERVHHRRQRPGTACLAAALCPEDIGRGRNWMECVGE